MALMSNKISTIKSLVDKSLAKVTVKVSWLNRAWGKNRVFGLIFPFLVSRLDSVRRYNTWFAVQNEDI